MYLWQGDVVATVEKVVTVEKDLFHSNKPIQNNWGMGTHEWNGGILSHW
tara:strand:- start:36 stop:182 length:147 start_codon:yes stop_codon:yes gene_type:complete